MLYLLSGASASGKKTVAPRVTRRVSDLVAHHENEIPASTSIERMANMERWLEMTLRYESEGKDLLLLAASPLGEVLASPRATELTAIAACLLDCHDHERSRRLALRPPDPKWPFGMDTLCWAAWHRMHAIDPQFEQRVVREPAVSHYHWERWASWKQGDPRWRVEYVDTTSRPVSQTVDVVAGWIEHVRAHGTPLSRAAAWWQ
jgi:hypothetical protein